MAITTYAELQASVANWLNRSDLTSQIPDFIALAEAEMRRVLKTRFVQTETVSLVADDGDYTISAAANLIGDYEFYITSSAEYAGRLHPVTPGQLYDNRRLNYNATARPVLFAIQDDEILVSPVPDTSYTAVLSYEGLAALSDSNTTNYVLTNAPDLYLFGALSMAELYVHNDERMPLWKAQFNEGIEQLKIAKERAEFPNTPVMGKPVNLAPSKEQIYGR